MWEVPCGGTTARKRRAILLLLREGTQCWLEEARPVGAAARSDSSDGGPILCSAAATEAVSSRQALERTTQSLGQRPFVTTKSNNEARRCGGNSQPDAFRGLPRNQSCSAERQPHLVLRRVWATIAAYEALYKTMGDSWFDGKKWRNTGLDRGDGAARMCDEGEDDRGVEKIHL